GPEERRGDPRAVEKPAPAEQAKRSIHAAGPRAASKPHPPAKAPPQTTDLSPFAPAGAHLVLLLRSEPLRRSPHREGVETILRAPPDYETLLGGRTLSPTADLDALLIATADPHDVTATFLAARHADAARIRDAVTKRALPEDDPRVFRSISPGLTVLTRPD